MKLFRSKFSPVMQSFVSIRCEPSFGGMFGFLINEPYAIFWPKSIMTTAVRTFDICGRNYIAPITNWMTSFHLYVFRKFLISRLMSFNKNRRIYKVIHPSLDFPISPTKKYSRCPRFLGWVYWHYSRNLKHKKEPFSFPVAHIRQCCTK